MYATSLKLVTLLYLTSVFCNAKAQCKAEVKVFLVNATTVNISWTISLPCSFNDTVSYHLWWRLEDHCSSTDPYQNIIILNETFYILTGLKEDSEYSVYISTQYHDETFIESDEKCFKPTQGSVTGIQIDRQCIIRDCNNTVEEKDQTTNDGLSTDLQLWVKILVGVVSPVCILIMVIAFMHCYCTRPGRRSNKSSKIFVDTALWGPEGGDDDKVKLSSINPTMPQNTIDSHTTPQDISNKQSNIVTLEAAHPMVASVTSVDYEPHEEKTLHDDAINAKDSMAKINLELDPDDKPTATTFEPTTDRISIPLIQISYTEESLYDDAVSTKVTTALNKPELTTEEISGTSTFKPLNTDVAMPAPPPIKPIYTNEDLYDDAVSAKEMIVMNKPEVELSISPITTDPVIPAPPSPESYTVEDLYDDAISAKEMIVMNQPEVQLSKSPITTDAMIPAPPPLETYTVEDLYDDAISAKETIAMNTPEVQLIATTFNPVTTDPVIPATPPPESYTDEVLYDNPISATAKDENTVVYADVATCKKEVENVTQSEPHYEETRTVSKGKALITIQAHQYSQLTFDKSTVQQKDK